MEPEIMTAISWGMVTTGAIGLIAAGTPLVRAVSRSLFGRAGGIFQYQEASAFLTKPEQQAFDYLQKALSGRGHVCPKVRVADLVHVDPTSLRETGDRMRALGHIAQKHVDFVVMGPGYKPVFAVEVDDASHAREDRRARDVSNPTVQIISSSSNIGSSASCAECPSARLSAFFTEPPTRAR